MLCLERINPDASKQIVWDIHGKGVCHEIFDPHLFRIRTQNWSQCKQVKIVTSWIYRDNQMFKNLWGMNDTAESIRHNKLTVFAGSFPPPTRTLRYHYNCRLGLCGVIPTANSDSSVSFPPPTRTLRCHSHCRLGLCGVIPTADSDSAVSLPLPTRTLRCHSPNPENSTECMTTQSEF